MNPILKPCAFVGCAIQAVENEEQEPGDFDYCWTHTELFKLRKENDRLLASNQQLVETLELANKYLETSYDQKAVLAVYLSPAQAMRNAANQLEQKDRDIETIRQALAAAKESK